MIHIKKSPPPKGFAAYCRQPDARYSELSHKAKKSLKQGLLRDQGYLCAYCMGRIDAGEMKVEHIDSQAIHPELELDYDNLLGCCYGGERDEPDPFRGRRSLHCDSSKAARRLTCSPLDPACIASLSYGSEGCSIHSSNPEWDEELDRILNLNTSKLRHNRQEALYTLLDELQQLLPPHSSRHRQRSVLTKLLERVTARDRYGELIPYCGILIYWLERMLRELEGEHTAG